MLNIDLKECCRECGHIKIDIESFKRTNFYGNVEADTTIKCIHQSVCKEYREQSEDKRLVK